jgi:hypothetical protein
LELDKGKTLDLPEKLPANLKGRSTNEALKRKSKKRVS